MSTSPFRYDLLQAAREELEDEALPPPTDPPSERKLMASAPAKYEISSAMGIQKVLAALGCYPEDGPFNGSLKTDLSIRAIKWFQGDSELNVDGYVGPKQTLPALDNFLPVLSAMPASFVAMRRWRLTHYYIADQARWKGRQDASIEVYDNDKKVLAKVEPYFFAEMALEGTGKLTDGRMLNVTGKVVDVDSGMYAPVLLYAIGNKWVPSRPGYAGIRVRETVPGSYRVVGALAFHEVKDTGKEGFGVGNSKISYQYFKTLAADLGRYKTSAPQYRDKGGLVPVGTKVMIAEIQGQSMGGWMSQTQPHDGWFTVNDTGGGIFGAHFDIFSGFSSISRNIKYPHIGHIWFEGIEDRVPYTYTYGHEKR